MITMRLLLAFSFLFSTIPAKFAVDDDTIRGAVDDYLEKMRSGTLDDKRKEDDISSWDTSRVTRMALLFEGETDFSADLSSWDTGSVTDMRRMFKGCSSFASDLNDWDVSRVENMSDLFNGATLFNSDLDKWDTRRVTSMARMFYQARLFMKDVSGFRTSFVRDMSQMFMEVPLFAGGDLTTWDVSQVTNLSRMFQSATSFNGDISTWNVRLVTNVERMLSDAVSFRGDLSPWRLDSVEMMGSMFQGALQYSQFLCWDALDVVNVVDAADAFCGTQAAGLDPCCVDSYLVEQSCCSSSADVCQSACLETALQEQDTQQLLDAATENSGGDVEIAIEPQNEDDATVENGNGGEDGNWQGIIDLTQGAQMPSNVVVVPDDEDLQPTNTPTSRPRPTSPTFPPTMNIPAPTSSIPERDVVRPPTNPPVPLPATLPPTETQPLPTNAPSSKPTSAAPSNPPSVSTSAPTMSPTAVPATMAAERITTSAPTVVAAAATEAPSASEAITTAPTVGSVTATEDTEEPTAVTDDFFLDRPDTDNDFQADDGFMDEDEKQPTSVQEVDGGGDVYLDGANIVTAIEEMEEAAKEPDAGLVAVTASFVIVILLMLVAFAIGSWHMQETSFAGMPDD